jgi:hypothetical protein
MKTNVPKKAKLYDGDVAFNYAGNPLGYLPYSRKQHVTADQLDGIYFLENVWDGSVGSHVKRRSVYTLGELNYVQFPTPLAPNWNKSVYVGEIDNCMMVKNFIWDDELKFIDYERGQYSVGMKFVSTRTGKEYYVFLTNFAEFVGEMVNGIVKGNFTFSKRGGKFGLRILL